MKINSKYYVSSKIVGKNKIEILKNIRGKKEKVKFDQLKCELYNINESFANKEFENAQKAIKSLIKEKPKDLEVILMMNKNQKINTNKIKNNENFRILEKIMGEGGLKKQLNKAIKIISKKEYDIGDVKSIMKELKIHFDNLKDLEFQTPKFENQLGPPNLTNNYCDKYKNEFKDMIIGKLESLIKAYDEFDSLKKKTKKNVESFNKSFSVEIFEKKRPKIKKLKINEESKFTINYPYIALWTDSDVPRLQFGYSSYNLTIGPILTSFYSGTKFIYNIVSFVDKNLSCKIIFDEDKIDEDSKMLIPYLSIKSKVPSSEPIPIIFTVPNISKIKNHILKGNLEIKIDGSDIEPLIVEFTFKIILLPIEIYFTSKEMSFFWDENRLCLKNNTFKENDSFGFRYIIRNFDEDISFLNQNYSLKSTGKNEVNNKPLIAQDKINKNNFIIQLPSIDKKQEILEGLFRLYFTNSMSIPLELSGIIKKPEFKVFFYDLIFGQIEENIGNIYVYKHLYKSNKSFEIEMNFRIQLFDKEEHKYKIKLPYTYNPDYYIKCYFKGVDPKYNILSGKIKEGKNFDIIIRFPPYNRDYSDCKTFSFSIDEETNNFLVNIKREGTSGNPNYKFVNFPYKALINGEYKIIQSSDIKELVKNTSPIICYSPFSVKYYKLVPDILAEPGKIKSCYWLEDIKLIAFLKDKDNFWAPNTDYFGNDKDFDTYEPFDYKIELIDEAISRICKIANNIKFRDYLITAFRTKLDYEKIIKIDKNELNKYGYFFDFICWLLSDKISYSKKMHSLNKVFMNMGDDYEVLKPYLYIKVLYEKKKKNEEDEKDKMEKEVEEGGFEHLSYEEAYFESDIKDKDKEEKNDNRIEDNKSIEIIGYYNIIIKLRKIIQIKYEILKQYNFNVSKLFRFNEKYKFKKNINICFPPYDEKKFIEEVIKHMIVKMDEKKHKGELSDTWLFNEYEANPKPVSFDEIKKNDEFMKEFKKAEGKNLDLNLNILKIKDLSEATSLDKIISVLNNGFSISQAFMFCIGKLKDDKINEIFNYLYEIYHIVKESTKSILSVEIKLFNNSFQNLCRSLINSKVDLSKFADIPKLSGKIDNAILNEEKPSPISYSFPKGIMWKGSRKDYYNRYEEKKEEEKDIQIYMEEKKDKIEETKKEEKKLPEPKKEKPAEIPETKVEFGRTGGKNADLLDDNNDSEDEEGDELKKLEKIHLQKADKIVVVTTEEINKLKAVSDENVTNTIVKRMIKKRIENKLSKPESYTEFKSEIYGDRDNIMIKKINRKEGEDYVDQPLYSLLNGLSKNLYIKFFQQCINFDRKEVCAIIALDICRTIDKKYKLLHTLIATAMAHCFNSIEIPYSIVVFCDYGVQFIIKDFEEPHQEEISQLIFDAIMVPRCATRIADACYFISEKVNCKGRINKKIFIISNGLDTKLKIGEQWAPIFKNENEKFCFYFVKPELKDENEMNEIIKIWNDFQEKTKTELSKVSQNDIFNCDPIIYESFKNIMQSKNYKSIESSKKLKSLLPEFKEIVEFKKSDFMQLLDSINKEIIAVKDYFVQNRIHIPSKGKYKLEDIKVKNPFSAILGRCRDDDYNKEQIDKDAKSALEKLFSNPISSEMKLEYIEFIFTPNKPSMYSPSTKGTRLYLMGLINFCITHGQDNKIWLEKNKGLKKDYRATVIIDSSISCFNDYMRPHSIKTVLAILRMLSLVEIPYFDLIIATPTKPIVLSCGNDTTNSLNFKSNLWNLLLEQLTYNEEGCNLLDCLQLAYKLKSVNSVKKYYTFVLTDGMFDQKESEDLQDYISFCEESSLEVFGIGLGYYPEGIKKIFNKCIWSINPFMILKAMSVFFGNSEKHLENLPLIGFEKMNLGIVLEKFSTIISKMNSYQEYKTLYGFLDGLEMKMESLDEITNPDNADVTSTSNPEISDKNTMCPKGDFEGFKILIGQFWSCALSKTESEWVDKKYLSERFSKDKECLKEVLEYYSIEIVIKEDYKECIQELQTGKYYAHWIICGDGGGKLPNGGNPNLIYQYIDALKIFWVNGGSIVFWNDNEPFSFECNLFLESAEFPGDVSKTKVRFSGNHDGKSIMKPGDISAGISGKNEFGIFNNKRLFTDGKYPMFSLGHNLVKIAEGTTVSFVEGSESIAPFNTFGYEHEGGANILFYTPPFKYNHGYLILEGGFTKLFNELDTDGTKRYVLNIAAFTTQFAKRLGELGENWKTDFKITPFDFTIDESIKDLKIFKPKISREFDIVYLLDATGSMGSYLAAARDQCINISNQLKSELSQFDFNFGAVFYRDPIDCPGERNHTYALKSDVEALKRELASESASGGGDGPEDWVGGFDMALDNIAWRSGTRLIIHIADAPAHGSQWCGSSNHESENSKLYPMVQKCVDKNIKIIGFQIGSYPKPSFSKFEKEYNSRGGKLYKICPFSSGMSSSQISQHFKDMVIESTHAAAPK